VPTPALGRQPQVGPDLLAKDLDIQRPEILAAK
jgi:hypothetical protein